MQCEYCKGKVELVTGKEIYPSRADLHSLKFWLCRPCHAYVGCHKNSPNNAPLGRLANAELRSWKQRVHALLDPLWKQGSFTRNEAYSWLAKNLNIPIKECHVGMFDVDRCKKAVNLLNGGTNI